MKPTPKPGSVASKPAVHSPLPWTFEPVLSDIGSLKDADGEQIQVIPAKDAALIVPAVNSHAALVQALKECRRELGYMGSEFDGLVAEADAALKLAGEEI